LRHVRQPCGDHADLALTEVAGADAFEFAARAADEYVWVVAGQADWVLRRSTSCYEQEVIRSHPLTDGAITVG